jgi:hypothetical protein
MAKSRTPPAWRRPFLRELARSGSVKLAADKCGIDHTTPYQARRKNPAFAASWERALATARERLSPCPSMPPAASLRISCREAAGRDLGQQDAAPEAPACAGAHEGSGQVRPKLRDDEIVRASKAGRPCIARPGPGRWTAGAERTFLAVLTATANVKAAARAAGVSTVAVYNRRKNWPAFAEQWRIALAEGYVRLETLLIHAATATLDPEPELEARPESYGAPAMTVEQAMHLFKLHRASQHGGKPQRYGWRRQEPDIEDVRAEILRKVAALEQARGSQARG